MGLFRLPGPAAARAPVRRVVSTAQRYSEVSTLTDLKAAIAAAASISQGQGVEAIRGSKIMIAAPMRFDAPIDIPPPCIGIEIGSLGGVSITANGLVEAAFIVRSPLVALRGLLVPEPNDVANRFAVFVKPGVWLGALAPPYVTIDDCFVAADQLYTDDAPSFSPSTWHVTRNRFFMGADSAPAIYGQCERWLITDNSFDGATDAIELVNASTHNRISRNYLGEGNVTTDASAGANVIAENTRAGTLTLHVDDEEGLNS